MLQNTMSLAAVELRSKGVLYPRSGRSGVAHHDFARTLRNEGPAERAAFISSLALEVESSRAVGPELRLALISSEVLSNLCLTEPAADFAEFLVAPRPSLEGTAVIFLREITSFLESSYLQRSRARSLDHSFEAHLGPRHKWVESFFWGLSIMKARMGEAFEIVLPTKGYDVLRAFESRLKLPNLFLDSPSQKLPSNVRPSLKVQVALANFEWLKDQVGFNIDQKALGRLLSGGEVFSDDVKKFTVYKPGQRAQIAATFSVILKEAGFYDYAAMSEDLPPQTMPYHSLDRAALTRSDLAALVALRDKIEPKGK